VVVDFAFKNTPSYRVASIVRVGPWKEDNLRTEFGELVRWANRQRVPTGKWIFFERSRNRWEACLEIRGTARAEGRIRMKTLPSARAAAVVFDPDRVSSRIVYHGLIDWTRSERRTGRIREVTEIREVYPGDPWKDKRAWSRCEVQFLVRR
jgi:effector-binding domain-containing protein